MTWNYSTALATSKDQVRFLIGDTDSTEQLLQDEEITWLLTQDDAGGNVYVAAAAACRSIAAKFARKVDKTVGPFQLALSQRIKHYLELRKELLARAARGAFVPTPYSGGQSLADKETDADDDDLDQPEFAVGIMDAPGTTPPFPPPTETT